MSDDDFYRLRGRAVRAAQQARKQLGLSPEEPVDDLLRRVESDGVGVAILDLGAGVAGAYSSDIAFVNGGDAPQRQRFTLAHEYGHHCLEHGRSVDDPLTLTDLTVEPEELQANAFAAEFLLPRPAVKRWMRANAEDPITLETVVRLAAAFGVSAAAACRRLRTMKRVDKDRGDRLLCEIYDGEHVGLVEQLGIVVPHDAIARAQEHLPRLPAQLRDSALGALLTGEITVEQLAAQLHRDPGDVVGALEASGLSRLLPRRS